MENRDFCGHRAASKKETVLDTQTIRENAGEEQVSLQQLKSKCPAARHSARCFCVCTADK